MSSNRVLAVFFGVLGLAATTNAALRDSAGVGESQQTMWIVAGGSRTASGSGHLDLAARDARAFVDALATMARRAGFSTDARIVATSPFESPLFVHLERVASRAQPDDLVRVYLAGHGRERERQFELLPGATPANAQSEETVTTSELASVLEKIAVTGATVRLYVDACRTFPSPGTASEEPWSKFLALGVEVVTASQAGQPAMESETLGHGTFTWALTDALRGGLKEDSAVVAAVNAVPRLTGRRQQPEIHGFSLPAETLERSHQPGIMLLRDLQARGPAQSTRPLLDKNRIVVFDFRDPGGAATRTIASVIDHTLSSDLGKVGPFDVLVGWWFLGNAGLDDGRDLSPAARLAALRNSGVGRVIEGEIVEAGGRVTVMARVIETESGRVDPKASVTLEAPADGDANQLSRELAVRIASGLGADPSALQRAEAEVANESVDALMMLLQAEGAIEDDSDDGAWAPAFRQWFASVLPPPAFASPAARADEAPDSQVSDEGDASNEDQIAAFFSAYARAHEDKDLDELGRMYVSFSEKQRRMLHAYLSNAKELNVELTDLSIVARPDDRFAVSYTRKDRFQDGKTGKPLVVEARLTKLIVKVEDRWLIAGNKPKAQ